MTPRTVRRGRAAVWIAAFGVNAAAADASLSISPGAPSAFEEVSLTIEPPSCYTWVVSDRRLHTIELEGTAVPAEECRGGVFTQFALGTLDPGHWIVSAHHKGSTEIVDEVRFDVKQLPGSPSHFLDLGFSNPAPRAGEPFGLTLSLTHTTCDHPDFSAPAQVIGDTIVITGDSNFCGILPVPIFATDGFHFTVPGLSAGTKTVEVHDGLATTKVVTFHVDADATTLGSFGGVLETNVRWTDRAGVTHDATATRLSDSAGQFWFFGPDNPEITVKLVDGSAYNAAYWVFVSSLTDLGFTVTVHNSACSPGACVHERTYTQEPGHNRNFIDTAAFPVCANCSP